RIYDTGTSPNRNRADADSDGLLDFQEIHKYRTDPTKRDTDGDGIADSDWNERREYTYSVRSVLQFMPPFDAAALNDDFQDARVLERRDDYIELEVVHYPFATAGKSIESNLDWQQDYAGMTRYLKPGITTNWDAKMKQDLLSELRADGIIIDKLADKEVVEQVSSWLVKKSKSLNNVFTTYYIYYPNDQATVYPGLEGAFEGEFNRDKDNYDWTIDRHFDYELLGRGMFYNKTHGACTSFAVYLTTVLRAVGIPTRMIIVIPAVEPSDQAQAELVRERITHNRVRETMLAGLRRSGTGFTAHTFNEVYVGKRWHRLNFKKLGQPILDEGLFGLHTHLYTFNDLSEADLAATWGWRYGKGERSAVLKHNNPYTAVTLSDLFGCHSSIANPVITKTAQDQLPGSLPNIYVMAPAGLSFNAFEEVLAIVKDATLNKTGRDHAKKSYDEVFVKGIWGRKPGDIVVLLFSLDTEDRVPAGYEDLLSWEWSAIENHLKQGNTLEIHHIARDLNVILLAAPKRGQLQQLIRDSQWLGKFAGHDGKHRPDEPWATTGNVQGPVEYSITIPDEDWRRVEVKARFVTDGVLSLWMNNNGAPKVPDGHGAFVRNLTVMDSAGNTVPVKDFGRARWTIGPVEKQAVTLKYELLLEHDTSDLPWGPDEAPYVTDDGVFWTGRALFIVADMSNITVRFKLPDDWHVSTPWKPAANGGAAYLLQDEENLTEAFVFAGTHLEQRAKAKDMQILVALGSEFKKSKEILQETSQSLLNAYAGLFQGTVPGQTLIVVNHQDRKGRFDGGVFGRSVSMLMSDKPSQSNAKRWVPFMAHEVFHLWNGQFIRHSGQEQWLSEGFTDYYAIVASARTGLVEEREFVQRLERACKSYCAKSGQKPIRRAPEHALQYAGGSLVALC
ncbi:MAG: M61 family metallopeptidase, partial [Planctomycetota bacterium]